MMTDTEIEINGEPASVIAKRARDRGLIWLRNDPRTHPNRLTPEELDRLVKQGVIKLNGSGNMH